MSETSHKNPTWQQAEIDFLLRNGIVSRPQQLQEFNHVKSRWVYRTLREVLLTPSGHVLKRFTHFPGRRDHRRVWLREHAALTRLEGFSAPKSLGFITVRHADAKCTSVLYAREMIPDRPIGRVDDTVLEKIAELLAQFHH
ncbi:MAG: hypothetical protein R3280_10155 [Marinobacter sp.]|uniref:hypothetical protein n=1 Tax=Marinobacter sp. TaxID=50741 RepID=UPI00299EF20B|nr:hypothetical protein [Marinobacter sp.]MDX1634991.1 hypothetical protein [Marinobacter sp.]